MKLMKKIFLLSMLSLAMGVSTKIEPTATSHESTNKRIHDAVVTAMARKNLPEALRELKTEVLKIIADSSEHTELRSYLEKLDIDALAKQRDLIRDILDQLPKEARNAIVSQMPALVRAYLGL